MDEVAPAVDDGALEGPPPGSRAGACAGPLWSRWRPRASPCTEPWKAHQRLDAASRGADPDQDVVVQPASDLRHLAPLGVPTSLICARCTRGTGWRPRRARRCRPRVVQLEREPGRSLEEAAFAAHLAAVLRPHQRKPRRAREPRRSGGKMGRGVQRARRRRDVRRAAKPRPRRPLRARRHAVRHCPRQRGAGAALPDGSPRRRVEGREGAPRLREQGASSALVLQRGAQRADCAPLAERAPQPGRRPPHERAPLLHGGRRPLPGDRGRARRGRDRRAAPAARGPARGRARGPARAHRTRRGVADAGWASQARGRAHDRHRAEHRRRRPRLLSALGLRARGARPRRVRRALACLRADPNVRERDLIARAAEMLFFEYLPEARVASRLARPVGDVRRWLAFLRTYVERTPA